MLGVAVLCAPTAALAEPGNGRTTIRADFVAPLPPPPARVGVCVVDSGVSPIEQLLGSLGSRVALDGGTPDDIGTGPASGQSHGTAVAAVMASSVDGIAPQAITVKSVRVFTPGMVGANGLYATSALGYADAIRSCYLDPSVKVINLSLGSPGISELNR